MATCLLFFSIWVFSWAFEFLSEAEHSKAGFLLRLGGVCVWGGGRGEVLKREERGDGPFFFSCAR